MRRGGLGPAAVGVALLALLAPGVFAAISDSTSAAPNRVTSAPLPGAGELAAVGDRVWLDTDHDGLQSPGEPGVDGVTVTLLDGAGDPVTVDGHGDPVVPQRTQTVLGVPGIYGFDDLPTGDYRLAFSGLPPGHRLTVAGGTPGDGTDSDPDPADGRTPVVALDERDRDLTVDAGLWAPAPLLTLDKRVQGATADAPPGPSVPVGDDVAFDYLVTNRGNEPLEALAVSDDQGVAVTCSRETVAVGETVACAGTATAVLGPYVNVGTATAVGQSSGLTVTDDDLAHYSGVIAGLDVELTVNGEDADTAADAVEVRVGDPVTHAVVVANAGSTAIDAIAVVDDDGAPVSCPATALDPATSMTCAEWTGSASAGPQVELVTATGTLGPGGEEMADTDAANHVGRTPALSLLKEVLDPATGTYRDADADGGTPGSNDGAVPTLAAGATARYRFTVANTGDMALTSATVDDDRCDAPPTVAAGDAVPAGVLDVGETWRLTCAVGDVASGFTNTATVSATSSVGLPDGDGAAERATVEVAGPAAVALVKQVQDPSTGTFGEDAAVASGADATFRLQVINTGEAPLADLVISDPSVPDCDRVFAGPLAAGASTSSWTCTRASVTVGFTNIADVTARPATGAAPVGASDEATVTASTPAAVDLRLDKVLADHTGATATFRLTVTNEGPGTAAGPFTVVDDLPDGLVLASADGTGWVCDHEAGTVTCTRVAGLADGARSSVFLVASVAADAPPTIRNLAVLAAMTDADPADNADTAVVDNTGGGPGPGPGRGPGPGSPPGPGSLAATGAEVVGLLLLGMGLAGVGVVLLVAARRRYDEPYRPRP